MKRRLKYEDPAAYQPLDPAHRWAVVRADDGTTQLTPWCSSPEEASIAWEELRSGDLPRLETEIASLEEVACRLLPEGYG
jgi:hypothetical protein